DAEGGVALAHERRLERSFQLALQLVDDGPWRFRRREDAYPGGHVESGEAALLERRDVGERIRALRARHAEAEQPVGAHVLLRSRDRGEDQRNLPADHVGDRLAAALVGNVFELRPGALPEELACEMRRAARAGGAV